MRRKHISWKTWAAAVLASACPSCGFRYVPYDDVKKMTEDQFLSLFQRDHNMLYSSEHEHRDAYWNLTPMPIKAHREKTKRDAKIIAKSRRITNKEMERRQNALIAFGDDVQRLGIDALLTEYHAWQAGDLPKAAELAIRRLKHRRKIRSRGFDKTRTRGLDGRVRTRRTKNVSRNYSPP
jgi:hypothetical protein